MWKSKHSVLLSLIITYFFFAVFLALLVTAPWLFPYYVRIAGRSQTVSVTLIASFYCCSPAALTALCSLLVLLYNIKKNKVFVKNNITCLRILSWCCFYVAAVCFVSCFFYLPFCIVSAAALFFALILRVIKNAFTYAALMKEENDLTI